MIRALVIADPKVDEQHTETKYSKCNSFQVTTDLLNSENLEVAIARATGLQFYYIIADPKVHEKHM